MFPLAVASEHHPLYSDGDIRLCEDYKIGVNHKVFLDSYPILNVEVAFHALAGMSVFTKIDFLQK